MSSQWNQFKPPPLGPVIPPSVKHAHSIVERGSFTASWPNSKYPDTIISDRTIDYSVCPFNFLKVDPPVLSPNITININQVPVGTMIMVQIDSGTINFIANTTINISSVLTKGTHIIVIFSDAIRHNDLTNPTAT